MTLTLYIMVIWILYIIFLILFLILFTKVLPIIITEKIYKFNLSKKQLIKLTIIVIFFPLSIFFLKGFYDFLKNKEKINWLLWFLKVFWTIIVLSIILMMFFTSIRDYVAQPFQIYGQSMAPTIYDKEFLLSTKIWWYSRGDIIIHKFNDRYIIQRIIGVPWDFISIKNWYVYIKKSLGSNYVKLDEKYLRNENLWNTTVWWLMKEHNYIITDENYFVMWDNRSHSSDSRTCFSYTCNDKEESKNYVYEKDITWKIYFNLWYFNFKTFSYYHTNLDIETLPKFFIDYKNIN